jgi:hypothetical protein
MIATNNLSRLLTFETKPANKPSEYRKISEVAKQIKHTFSNGSLGSYNDEERSEMRYVLRIALPASHQNFERILRFPLGSISVGVSVELS